MIMQRVRSIFSPVVMLACVAMTWPLSDAAAKTLVVGPNEKIKLPSEAAKLVADGDTVEIEPMKDGYFDCAVWKANRLTIEGKGDGVVITDKACEGKALFVTAGNDITIRNITFQRARVPDHNGAGIRIEGANPRIEHSRFINNEDGILSSDSPDSTVTILDSEFDDNGKCESGCAHAIYINHVALLHIEHCVFKDTKVGHHIKSRALRTEIIDNDIEDGPDGTASYLIDAPNGGSLIVKGNTMEKGPKAENHSTAITIGEEGVTWRTKEIVISDNKFTNDMSAQTFFVRNGTATPAVLTGNSFKGKIVPLEGDGSVH